MNNYSYSQSSVFNDDGSYTPVGNRHHYCKPQQMLEACTQFVNIFFENRLYMRDHAELWYTSTLSVSPVDMSLAVTFKVIVDEVYPGFNKLNDTHGRDIIELYIDAVRWIKENSFCPTSEQVLFAWVKEVMIPLLYSSERYTLEGTKYNEKLYVWIGLEEIRMSLVPDYMTGIYNGKTCLSPQQEVLFWHKVISLCPLINSFNTQALMIPLRTITKFWLETLR